MEARLLLRLFVQRVQFAALLCRRRRGQMYSNRPPERVSSAPPQTISASPSKSASMPRRFFLFSINHDLGIVADGAILHIRHALTAQIILNGNRAADLGEHLHILLFDLEHALAEGVAFLVDDIDVSAVSAAADGACGSSVVDVVAR